ncbi:alpha/beta fold hydrolase [Kineococcus arenarius]|uniref:alpha/beta fold hydrolase n=1 Tax=unclassified Kineococcus TaxID=2621656 RepID=UPI003D7E2F90
MDRPARRSGPALRESPVPTHRWEVDGETVTVEVHGHGRHLIVLEAGLGNCRTSWDVLVPYLLEREGPAATVVTYDRPGAGLSPAARRETTVEAMAHRLAGLVDQAATDTADDGRVNGAGPGARIVLAGHSLGGLITRCALPLLLQRGLGEQIAGLVLLDPTTETADAYGDPDYYRRFGQLLAAQQQLARLAPLRRWATTARRRDVPPATGEAMIREDFTPSRIARARREHAALRDAVPRLRRDPPVPPACPVVVLSAGHATKAAAPFRADVVAHQRAYADSLPCGRFESLPSGHFVHVQRAATVAAAITGLLI